MDPESGVSRRGAGLLARQGFGPSSSLRRNICLLQSTLLCWLHLPHRRLAEKIANVEIGELSAHHSQVSPGTPSGLGTVLGCGVREGGRNETEDEKEMLPCPHGAQTPNVENSGREQAAVK